ncbi:hypothetical protein NDU88_001599 [Pleurodeles waltl]|uniref:Uncharacterized protein n=1 Tax=Pleurodeles waltl TaxID=8319 RepID=A0AAV7Q7K0_PLEWA|nr:hypothetical protein NDU88_001599 [Pleurodeles waltl]
MRRFATAHDDVSSAARSQPNRLWPTLSQHLCRWHKRSSKGPPERPQCCSLLRTCNGKLHSLKSPHTNL